MKGFADTTLVKLVLALILLFIVLASAWHAASSLFDFTEQQECKTQMQVGGILSFFDGVRVQNVRPSAIFSDDDPALCPVRTITIERRASEEVVKRTIADEMASCWNIYGRGKIPLFDSARGKNLYCAMCNYIEIEDDGTPREIHGFVDFLSQTTVPGLDLTYTEYLFTADDEQARELAASFNMQGPDNPVYDDAITSQTNYAIYYLYGQTRHFIDDDVKKYGVQAAIGTAGGIGGAVAFFALAGGPATLATGLITVTGFALTGMTAGVNLLDLEVNENEYTGSVLLIEHDSNRIEELGCSQYLARLDS